MVDRIVRGNRSPRPVVDCIAVESVAAGFRTVVYLSARLTTVLSGVSVAHNGDFLQFIAAQQKVARTGVVQVQERVIVVVTVNVNRFEVPGRPNALKLP